jgi:hypothetical protein
MKAKSKFIFDLKIKSSYYTKIVRVSVQDLQLLFEYFSMWELIEK